MSDAVDGNEDANGKSFENFDNLVPEIRAIMVNKMRPDDRCRYQSSSTKCNTEAMSSTNYIYELSFYAASDNHITIDVRHGDISIYGQTGYILEFLIEYNHIYMIYKDREHRQLWWKLIDCSMSTIDSTLQESAFQRFLELLKLHQKSIKELSITNRMSDFDMNLDFGITYMKKLESLSISGQINYLQFVSKTANPLKSLWISSNNLYPTPLEQIYEVQNWLNYNDLKLNYQQFRRLTASNICINIGQLTVENIADFIQTWQNSTAWRYKEVYWRLQGSSFNALNIRPLFRRFGQTDFDENESQNINLEIKHNRDANKNALLRYLPILSSADLKIIFRVRAMGVLALE